MRIEALSTGFLTFVIAQGSLGQIAVDPEGNGAIDVSARLAGSGDPFVPVPLAADSFFAGFGPTDVAELRVGALGPGEIVFHDAGSLNLNACVGALGGGSGRLVLSGATLVRPDLAAAPEWMIGGEGAGDLVIEGPAAIEAASDFPFRVGTFAPGTFVVRGGASVELFGGSESERVFEVGALTPPSMNPTTQVAPPADGRVSTFRVEGEGTEFRCGFLRTGGAMNATVEIVDGALLSVGPQRNRQRVILGSDFGGAARGTVHSVLRIDNAAMELVGDILMCSNQDSSIIVENGGLLEMPNGKIFMGNRRIAEPLDASIMVRGEGSRLIARQILPETRTRCSISVLGGQLLCGCRDCRVGSPRVSGVLDRSVRGREFALEGRRRPPWRSHERDVPARGGRHGEG